ncbi:hypothetical protein V2J09_021307 [Rumex salicifolius]
MTDQRHGVTATEFSTMEIEVHYNCMDGWTTILNKNEEARSLRHPNRLFLYVTHLVKTLAHQYIHAYICQRADMIEAATSTPYLVPLPCKSNVEDEYTLGIYTM